MASWWEKLKEEFPEHAKKGVLIESVDVGYEGTDIVVRMKALSHENAKLDIKLRVRCTLTVEGPLSGEDVNRLEGILANEMKELLETKLPTWLEGCSFAWGD